MVNPIPPYIPNWTPVPVVTPFTYRDGVTMLKKVDGIIRYLNRTVIPFINKTNKELAERVEADINNMITVVNAAIAELESTTDQKLTDMQHTVDNAISYVNTSIANLTTYVDEQVQLIIQDGIQVQDPVITGILNNPNSNSRQALDLIYAPIAIQDVVNNGRLSPANLDKKFKMYESVSDYGAIGNGAVDDRSAIQAAINAAAISGRTVFLGGGTYRITKPAGLDYFIELKPNVRITGPGTIKVANNSGDYRAIFAGATISTDLSNVTLDGITVDENNANNPVTTFNNFPRYILCVFAGDNVTVRNCTFKNIDSINTITINGANIKNAIVVNNMFLNVGQSATNHDHSTIYVVGQGTTITGNVFEGVPGGGGATTAIETHGGRQIVADNRVNNFYVGCNITGVAAQGSRNVSVVNNVFTNVLIGINLWSQAPGSGLIDVIVAQNNILLNRDIWVRGVSDQARGITVDPLMDRGIAGLSILNNTIEFLPTAVVQSSELLSAGIALWEVTQSVVVTELVIRGNVIRNSHAEGIRLAIAIDRGVIEDNYIVNPGTSPDPTIPTFYLSGIVLVATIKNVRIANNQLYDTRTPHKIANAIMTSVTNASNVYTERNIVKCADGTTFSPVVTTAGSGKTFLLNESMDVFANQGWARIGSKVFEESTGKTFVQTDAPDGFIWAERAL